MNRFSLATLVCLSTACGDKADDAIATDDTGETTGGTTTGPTMGAIFPAGTSEWTGTAELLGEDMPTSLEVTRTGSILEGTVSLEFSGSDISFTLLGTVDLVSGQMAMIPVEWVGADPGLELVGFTGVYDPDAGTLTGLVRDTTSWDNPDLAGGPITLSTTAAAEEVELAPISAEPFITEEGRSYAGTFQCTSAERPVYGSLARGSDGQLWGSLSFDEADGTYVGTFPVVGVEDAASGNMTLVPEPWTDDEAESTNYANFYVHGALSGSDYTGTVSQYGGMYCSADQFQVTFE